MAAEDDQESSSAVDFVAGWVAGAVAVLCVQPIDTWLTRRQASSSSSSPGGSNRSSIITTRKGGFSSWWRGSSPMIWSVPIQNALLMGGYGLGQKFYNVDNDKDPMGSDHRQRQLAAIFVGGCTGGIVQSFLMSPVELIKVTQQVTAKSLSTASVAWTMKWTSGLNATILRDGIPHGVWFVAYDVTKETWNTAILSSNHHNNNYIHNPYSGPLVAGAVAATVAWIVGYPADLIKTRIQAASSSSSAMMDANPTILQVAQDIVKQSGVTGLYKGFGLKLVRSIPASMIGFSVYELVKDAMVITNRPQ